MAVYAQYDRLLSLDSVHHAIRAEKLLTEAGIKVIALPTPREINISCGQCLLFMAVDQEAVLAILKQEAVQWSKMFSRDAEARVYIELADGKGENCD